MLFSRNLKALTLTLFVLLLSAGLWAEPPAAADRGTTTAAPDQPGKTRIVVNNRLLNAPNPAWDAQTVEAIKTFRERCPNVEVTLQPNNADFIVFIDRDPHRPIWRRHNKVAVFDHTGNAIFSTSTRSLGNAVQDACEQMASAKGKSTGPSADASK